MIRRLALTAGFAILGTVAFAPNAQAQAAPATETIEFSGTVSSTCAFTNTQPGILVPGGPGPSYVTGNNGIFDVGGEGTASQTTVNCSGGGSLAVSQPNMIQVPPGFNPAVVQAVVSDGTATPYATSPGPTYGNVWNNGEPTLAIAPGTNVDLLVGIVAGTENGPGIPARTYE